MRLSFVSIVARENFISIMSDGRVTGASGIPIQEDYQKFTVFDKSAFIAYAGTKDICETIVRDYEGFFRWNIYDFSMWVKELQELFRTADFESQGLKVNLGFGGVNQDEKIEFHALSSSDLRLQSFFPVKDDISFAFLNNTTLGDQIFNEKFVEFLKVTGFETPTNVIQSQKLLNNYVSQNDNTVNTKTFREVIRIDY